MLKGKLSRSYVSRNGNDTFVYAVSGTPAELEAFKTAQGDNHRTADGTGAEPEGTPLWFTTRCAGDNAKLVITSKGKVVADMSAYKQAASLVAQFGGNFGQELAKASVAQLLGGGATASEPAPVATPQGLGDM
jgi:hypothetical protein